LIAGTPRMGTLEPGDMASIRGGNRLQDIETVGVGDVITVTLCATGFDPYLVLSRDGTQATLVAEDDDGAGDHNSRVIYDPAADPSAGASFRNRLYTVHVTTFL